MKYFFFLVTGLVLIVFSSCSKQFKDVAVCPEQPVAGQWKWEYSIGGIAGQTITPSAKSVITLSLNNDSGYVAYLNNEIASQGKYYFATASNGDSLLRFDRAFHVENLFLQEQQLITHRDDTTLELFDYNISDGFGSHFNKVK